MVFYSNNRFCLRLFSITLLITVLLVSGLFAQNQTPEIQLPGSPGLSIIGVQTSEITKPGNYSGLYSNLLSPVISSRGNLPTNLAVEFFPYYLRSRDITKPELESFNPLRDLRISVATNSMEISEGGTRSIMGIGFRTYLIGGESSFYAKYDSPDLRGINIFTRITNFLNVIISRGDEFPKAKLIKDIENQFNADLTTFVFTNLIEIIQEKPDTLSSDDLSDIVEEIEPLIEDWDKINEKLQEDKYDYSNRSGHFLEVASAFALSFPEENLSSTDFSRWAVWLNYNYKPKKVGEILDLAILARLSNTSFDPSIINENDAYFGDLGGNINLTLFDNKLQTSLEYIGKLGISNLEVTDGENQYSFNSVSESKLNLSVGYRISEDVIWNVSYSEIQGDADYLNDKLVQLLTGLSVAISK